MLIPLMICGIAALGMSVAFAITYKTSMWIPVFSVPFSFFASLALCFLDRSIAGLHLRIKSGSGSIQAGFLAFFVYILGAVFIYSLSFSLPMGQLVDMMGRADLAHHYGRWSVNLAIILSLTGWVRLLFPAVFSGRRQ